MYIVTSERSDSEQVHFCLHHMKPNLHHLSASPSLANNVSVTDTLTKTVATEAAEQALPRQYIHTNVAVLLNQTTFSSFL